jgi:RNA polymerase sigma factor (sigma-70 family)
VNDQTDSQLLRAFAAHRSEPAFRELVRRHLDFVHAAAQRMVGDSHLAQDVSQGVFIALAKNAAPLADRPVLAGWLHRTAQNIAAQTVRTDVRRRQREQEAATMNEIISAAPDASWKLIAPHLDTALGELSEPDRDAVLLRYFERKSAAEIAQLLGVSDEAAQKRVTRAVEKLRDSFAKQKITVGAGSLGVLISANAVQSAPAGLAATISTAALAGTAVTTSTFIAATKTIAMTTFQKTIVTAALAVAAGAGIYEARQAAQLRDQVQTLQQQQAPLAEQNQKLQNNFADVTNRLEDLLTENLRLKSNPNQTELLKLRGEVTTLNNQLRQQAAEKSKDSTDPTVMTAKALAGRIKLLRDQYAHWQGKTTAELQLLSEEDWFSEVANNELNDDESCRSAMSNLRMTAKKKFSDAEDANLYTCKQNERE